MWSKVGAFYPPGTSRCLPTRKLHVLLHFMSQMVPMEMSLVICFNGSRKEEWQHSFADIPALAYTLKKLLLSKTGTKRKKKKKKKHQRHFQYIIKVDRFLNMLRFKFLNRSSFEVKYLGINTLCERYA